jgi:glutamine amidotransferase
LRFAQTGRPLLGICLGMQMLAHASEEFGVHEGLGLVAGRVTAIPDRDDAGAPLKRPHIGWSDLHLPDGLASWQGTCLENVVPGAAVYLVHSYRFVAADPRDVLAECRYGGHRITTAIRSNAIVGCQFHPEKSGTVGLSIVRRFIA